MAINTTRRQAPATTPAGREKQIAAMAYDLAEKQIAAGTASSQTIAHFLKLGSERERLERERLEYENKLIQAKIANMESMKNSEELYSKAIEAMKSYKGDSDVYDD